MQPHAPRPLSPRHRCQVLPASAFYVSHGVNLGDSLGAADEACLGDIYRLDPHSLPQPLELCHNAPQALLTLATDSALGAGGTPVTSEALLRLMAGDGRLVEVVLLRVATGERYLRALSPLSKDEDYSLLETAPAPKGMPLVEPFCVSFARGTRITRADGRLCPIEQLCPGDRILTRDHGAQDLRWRGQATLRAQGAFAPVVIAAGKMGNLGDLLVSPHHRLFLYQRKTHAALERAEVLVQAKHLLDGEAIFQREGGFVDYFSLMFDRHEIIYAEGIPVESLMLSETTLPHLPQDFARELHSDFPALRHQPHFGVEVSRQLVTHLGRERLIARGTLPQNA